MPRSGGRKPLPSGRGSHALRVPTVLRERFRTPGPFGGPSSVPARLARPGEPRSVRTGPGAFGSVRERGRPSVCPADRSDGLVIRPDCSSGPMIGPDHSGGPMIGPGCSGGPRRSAPVAPGPYVRIPGLPPSPVARRGSAPRSPRPPGVARPLCTDHRPPAPGGPEPSASPRPPGVARPLCTDHRPPAPGGPEDSAPRSSPGPGPLGYPESPGPLRAPGVARAPRCPDLSPGARP